MTDAAAPSGPSPVRPRDGVRRVVALTVGLALLLGGLGAWLSWRGYEDAKDREAQRIAAAAESSAGDISQFVTGRMQILGALSSADAFIRADVRAIDARLARLDPAALGLDAGIVWFDARDRPRAVRAADIAAGAPARGRLAATLGRSRAQGSVLAGPTLRRSLYSEPVVVLVAPTSGADGRPNGALVGAMSLRWLNDVAATRRQLRGGETLVVDRDGLLIVAPGAPPPRDVSDDPLLRRLRADAPPGRVSRGAAVPGGRNPLGQRDRLLGAATDGSATGWTVFIDRSSGAAYADARGAMAVEIGAVLLLVSLGAAAALVLGRRVLRASRANAEAERRTRALQRLTAALSASATPAEVADVVLRAGGEATSASAGSIAMLSADGSELVTLGLVGYSDEVARSFAAYPVSASLPMPDCLREGPLWLHDGDEVRRRYPHLAPFQATMTHEAVTAIPLRAGGRVLGGLALSFTGPRRFDDDERAQLLAVADICGQALDRARLYEEQRREAERERFLAEASVILATPLDPRETLAALARTAVPVLADWCSVSIERHGAIETVAVAHVEPAKVALAESFSRRFPSSLGDADGIGAVIRTGTSRLTPVVTPELIADAIPPGERRDAVLELGLASVMTVPLRARGRTVGALALASGDAARRFAPDDLRFAEDLGVRAGLAIENAALLDRSRRIARTLQSSLLPARLPQAAGLDVAARYVAGGEGVDVGGDFYDLFAIDGVTWIGVLGDVCGKGPEAAALTSLARFTVRADARENPPGEALRRLNDAVRREVDDHRFLTATLVRLEMTATGCDAVIARGGHPPTLILRGQGPPETALPRGPVIGVLEEVGFEERAVRLEHGDALLLFSDGVSETRSPDGAFFGTDGLIAVAAATWPASAEELVAAVEGALDAFRQGPPVDDIAMLVLHAVEERSITVAGGAADDRRGAAGASAPRDTPDSG